MENDQLVRQENHEELDQSLSDYEDQALESYKDQITLETFKAFFQTAKDMRKSGDSTESLIILRALIEKGSELYNSELNINLADVYFHLGDTWMERLDTEEGELVDAPMNIGGNNEQEDQQMILNDIMQNIGQQNFNIQEEGVKEDDNAVGEEADAESPKEQIETKNGDLAIQEEPKQEQPNPEANGEQDEDELEDIQVAWENIETAKTIIVKYLNEQQNLNKQDESIFLKKLAHCYIRLGDCENRKEAFESGLQEYLNSLKTLKLVEDMQRSRFIAEVYFLIGNTYLYRFEKGDIKLALENYINSLEIIKLNIADIKDLTDYESVALRTELQDISYNLEQKVEELEDEIATTAEDDLDKEKIKAIAGNKQEFPKSLFDTSQKVNKIGTFGKKREIPENTVDDKEMKKIRMDKAEENN